MAHRSPRCAFRRGLTAGPWRAFRKGAAALLLVLFALLLVPGGDAHDHEGQHHAHPPVCSLVCLDACATAPLPQTPVPPSPDRPPKADYAPDVAPRALSRPVEPEHTPPRS